jgi:hypothetical protein
MQAIVFMLSSPVPVLRSAFDREVAMAKKSVGSAPHVLACVIFCIGNECVFRMGCCGWLRLVAAVGLLLLLYLLAGEVARDHGQGLGGPRGNLAEVHQCCPR